MKVLVTGHLGYIGPYLVKFLRNAGYYVIGCDLDLFRESRLEEFDLPHYQFEKDFRQLTVDDLKYIDCLIHLASISNDPMGDLDPNLTYGINQKGSFRLAELAKKAGVKRFIFSSSCSIYGKSGDKLLTEEDKLSPLTAYAASKIEMEKFLVSLADDSFTTVSLRNSTAYGYSPVFRIDLVVNNLLASAVAKGKINIKSDGEPWRPLLHASDLAKAFLSFINCPAEWINGQAFNVGFNDQNYQVKDIADFARELVPTAEVVFTGEIGEDPRNYKVCFDKLTSTFPDFTADFDLKSGMLDLYNQLIKHNFSSEDFDSYKFTRLKLLRKNIHMLD